MKQTPVVSPAFILVLVIAMAVGALYLLIKGPIQFKEPASTLKDQTTTTKSVTETMEDQAEAMDVAMLIERVARHILINENETPFVATISNIDLVRQKNPDFYKDAEVGDKVLIWSDKAIIYSPAKDKIIAVVTAYVPPPEAPIEPTVMEDVNVEIRNGTRIAGAASRLKAQIEQAGIDVVRIGDASRTYQGTIVVDQTGGNAPYAVTEVLNLSGTSSTEAITVLPTGEPASDADILVIIGL